MKIVYSDHAKKRLRQRGVTELEIEHVLKYPKYIKKSFEGRKIAAGEANKRELKISFIEKESYIKIITVL
ncbi:MAG TPA: DUF4258 domain-containing protein [Candidatus Nanoarchaeia archaeon]|nr:DUF4258 domain-containing protein [Candidatus Nanoarchaeia archaeon]